MILIILIVILAILVVYFLWPRNKKQNDLVEFNAPFSTNLFDLLDILRDLHTSQQPEFDMEITLYLPEKTTEIPDPLIPFAEYFTVPSKITSIVKLERVDESAVSLILHVQSMTP
jgi:hypothetical protein